MFIKWILVGKYQFCPCLEYHRQFDKITDTDKCQMTVLLSGILHSTPLKKILSSKFRVYLEIDTDSDLASQILNLWFPIPLAEKDREWIFHNWETWNTSCNSDINANW